MVGTFYPKSDLLGEQVVMFKTLLSSNSLTQEPVNICMNASTCDSVRLRVL